jgi:PAS domain S-box-containing protein
MILGVALLALAGIIAYSVTSEHGHIDSTERERLTTQARVLDENLGHQLHAANQALISICGDLLRWKPTGDNVTVMAQRLRAICAAMPGTQLISIIDADGVVVASTRQDLIGRNVAAKDYFKAPRQHPDPAILYISPPFETVPGLYSISLARLVTGPKGEFAGVVSAIMDPEYFAVLLESVLYAGDMRASINHGDGKVFLMMPDRKDVEGMDLAQPGSFYTRHVESKRTVSLFKGVVRATGDTRMLVIRTVKSERFRTDKPLMVAVSRDLAATFAPWRRDSLRHGMLFGVLALMAVSGLYIYQRRERKFVRLQDSYAAAIQRSEQKYRDLVESSNSIILRWSREGKITFMNKFGREFFGYTEEEILGRHVVGTIVPRTETTGRDLEPLVDSIIANPKDFEQNINENMRRNGERVWISWTNKIVLDEQEQLQEIMSIGSDITERKQAVEALKTSEQEQRRLADELQAIIDSFPGVIVHKDTKNSLIWVNQYLATVQGVAKDQLEGKSLFDLWPADVAQKYWDDDLEVIRSGKPKLNIEEPWNTPEGLRWLLVGKIPFLDETGSIVGVIVVGQDITERRELEERLRESEERYRSLFENSHAIQLVIDPETGRIVDANPAARQYYGYDAASFRTLNIADINVIGQGRLREEMARAATEEQTHFDFLHRLAGGEVRPVEVYSGPITIMGKKLLYSIVHDISARKKAEEDRERLIAELSDALSKIRTLKGLLPICASCKKIRNDKGYWEHMELYIRDHSEADFSHGICPECAEKLYPGFGKKK